MPDIVDIYSESTCHDPHDDIDLGSSITAQGWTRPSSEVWHRVGGYRGAPTAVITRTPHCWIVDSFLMRPARRMICDRSLTWSDVVLGLQNAERGQPGYPEVSWLPLTSRPRSPFPEFVGFQDYESTGPRRIGAIINGRAVMILEVDGPAFSHGFLATINGEPLTDKDDLPCYFDNAAEAVEAGRAAAEEPVEE